MAFDRTILTDNYLITVVKCIEGRGYELNDFEFSTQRTHSYKKGIPDPKAVVYIFRVSTGIEMSYVLGHGFDFSGVFCKDLTSGVFDKRY